MWKLFDAIYCINLQHRKDRYKETLKELDKIGIKDKVQFYHPQKDPQGGLRGCYESHRYLIKQSYDLGHNYILIFEDDILYNNNINYNIESQIEKFMKNNYWEILYLGTLPDVMKNKIKRIDNNIYQMVSMCSHAYIISRRGMQKYKDLEYFDVPLDYLYMQASSQKSYGVYPSLFNQRISDSDIGEETFYLNFKPLVFNIIQNYAKNINQPIPIVLTLLLLLNLILIVYLLITNDKASVVIVLFLIVLLFLFLLFVKTN